MKKIDRDTYILQAQQVARFGVSAPTLAETMASDRAEAIDVAATHEGALVRFINEAGGQYDLMLNAAQAIHLFRSLARAGEVGGWMTSKGQARTNPPLAAQHDPLPVPAPKSR